MPRSPDPSAERGALVDLFAGRGRHSSTLVPIVLTLYGLCVPSAEMSAREEVADYWDEVLARWTAGDHDLPPDLRRWLASYAGKGDGAVDLSVFPEPYIGRLAGDAPALVMLGLNPGGPAPDFQGEHGAYTQRVRETSYRKWAASGPYTDEAWESAHGRNKYHRDRLTFARRFTGDEGVQPADLLYVELLPFHSKRVTAAIQPPADVLDRFVFAPVSELPHRHVFAFGKPWHRAAQALGLGVGMALSVEWSAPGREAREYRLPGGKTLVVVSQPGYAGPPGERDTEALRSALGV